MNTEDLTLDTLKEWNVDGNEIETELRAHTTLKLARPIAAQAIVDILRDADAHPRLVFDAAKYVIEHGAKPADGDDYWKSLTDAIKEDTLK